MSLSTLSIFLTAGLLAEVVATVAGFGSSTILMPVALLFFDFPTALLLVGIFHIAGSASRAAFFRRGVSRRVLARFGIPSILLTFVGALLVRSASEQMLKGLLGVFLVVYAALSLWRGLRLRPTASAMAVGGGLSGFLAGLIGTGGALRGAFLTAFQLPRDQYLANGAIVALAVDITRIPVYFREGFAGEIPWPVFPALVATAVAGSWIGRAVVQRVPQRQFQTVVFVALGLTGIYFIARTIGLV